MASEISTILSFPGLAFPITIALYVAKIKAIIPAIGAK